MWEIDFSEQVYTLIRSLLLGGAFCFVFEVYTAVAHRWRWNKLVVFFTDVIVFLLAGVFDFCFFLATTNGEIRGYVFAGQLIGFICFKLTLSRLLKVVLLLFFRLIDLVKKILKRYALKPINSFFKRFYEKIHKYTQKTLVFIKKRLKKSDALVIL